MSARGPRSRGISSGEGQFRRRQPWCTVAHEHMGSSKRGDIRHMNDTAYPTSRASISIAGTRAVTVPTEAARTLIRASPNPHHHHHHHVTKTPTLSYLFWIFLHFILYPSLSGRAQRTRNDIQHSTIFLLSLFYFIFIYRGSLYIHADHHHSGTWSWVVQAGFIFLHVQGV